MCVLLYENEAETQWTFKAQCAYLLQLLFFLSTRTKNLLTQVSIKSQTFSCNKRVSRSHKTAPFRNHCHESVLFDVVSWKRKASIETLPSQMILEFVSMGTL